jgi:hypothetical protein
MDEAAMDDAVHRITNVPGVEANTVQGVWATFTVKDNLPAAIQAANQNRDVVIHKVERSDGFLSVALEEYADEL